MAVHQNTHHRVVPARETRQAVPLGHVRYVLETSLALAIVAGVVLYLVYA